MSKKPPVEVFGVAFLLAMSIMFMLIFNLAVLNGGQTLVILDKYNEMVFELLLLNFVIWPSVSVGLYVWHNRE